MSSYICTVLALWKEKLDKYVHTNAKAKESWAQLNFWITFELQLHFQASLFQSRLGSGIGSPLEKLQTTYNTLVELQGAAMADAPTRLGGDKYVSAVNMFAFLLHARKQNEDLAKHFVSCTKEDTMMNTWVARARLEWVLLICSVLTPEFHSCFFFLCCTQFILITCRKWRPPETDEEKQLKKQRAQESKKRKKEAKEVKEEDWSWHVDALLQTYIGSIS